MRKTELTAAQLETRDSVAEAMAAAGWRPRKTNALFDQGWWVAQETGWDYQNGQARLALAYSAERGMLDLTVEADSARWTFTLLECAEAVRQVLDVIVTFQDDISAENCREHVRRLLTPCPQRLYLNTDGRLTQIK